MAAHDLPPGWHIEPEDPTTARWWDGERWTDRTISLRAPRPRTHGRVRRPLGGRSVLAVGAALVALIGLLGGGMTAALSGSAPATPAPPTFAPATVAPAAAAAVHAPALRPEATAAPRSSSPASATRHPAAGTALALLATLSVKGKAPLTGYARIAGFGSAWLDVDRNGCDTRNDVLRRDLTAPVGRGCRVLGGTLHDPYTGSAIRFVRGPGTSAAVQIDHVVALANAWRTGAQRLSHARRIDLANDPINLFAVDGPTNARKSDADAATWLPPARSFRCTYVAHQVAVKAAYRLWVTPAERDAMRRILSRCPTVRAPVPEGTDAAAPAGPVRSAPPTAEKAPAGATAVCRDGSFSSSRHRSGTCSRHGGVRRWL